MFYKIKSKLVQFQGLFCVEFMVFNSIPYVECCLAVFNDAKLKQRHFK